MVFDKRGLVMRHLLVAVILWMGVVYPVGADGGSNALCDKDCLRMRQLYYEQRGVVRIITMGKGVGNGTGIVIKEGILTNNHVIEGALKILVAFEGIRGYYDAAVIGRDVAADLALLSLQNIPQGVMSVSFGSSLQVGELVFALGYPLGVRSITVGRVSTPKSFSWLYAWTQTPIAPGSSGGPLFNSQGEMVGVNTAIVPIPGVTTSYVISVEYVKKILPRLMRERLVRHGAAGIGFADASHVLPVLLEQMGLSYPPEDGVMVLVVPPGSPADLAMIRPGDYITKLNGAPVKNAQEFDQSIFFDLRPDMEVEIELKRGRQVFRRRLLLSEYVSPLRSKNGNRQD